MESKFSRGFTLVEILVVLALIGVLALVVVPNLGGLIARGSQQGFNSEQRAIQAAVDSYYTDPTTKVAGVRQYPTKSGSGSSPTYGGLPPAWSNDGGFIYFHKIIAQGYMSDAPASAGYQNTTTSATTFGTGSYNWYVDPNGKVKAWYWPTPTPASGTPEAGFKSGVYP